MGPIPAGGGPEPPLPPTPNISEFRNNLDAELKRVGLADGLDSPSIQKNWDLWRRTKTKPDQVEWMEELMVGVIGATAGTHRLRLNSQEGYVYFEPKTG